MKGEEGSKVKGGGGSKVKGEEGSKVKGGGGGGRGSEVKVKSTQIACSDLE